MKKLHMIALLVAVALGACLLVSLRSVDATAAEPAALSTETYTILHTNDFHGRLETDYAGRGGSAYIATIVNDIRAQEGEDSVLLVDAGDVYFAAPPISQLVEGESAIDIYNLIGYDVAAFGNHEFDKSGTVVSRTLQSNFPWVGANIINEGTDWEHPDWVQPYVTLTLGSGATEVTLGVIGLDTDETPVIANVPLGLEFKDLTEALLHYYDEVAAQSDAIIVLAHMGTEDAGQYKGMKTVAQELADAGKPVDLIIAGHHHEPLFEPVVVGGTSIIEAGYYGRWIGRADITIDAQTKSLTLSRYELITVTNTITPDATIANRVDFWAQQVEPLLVEPVGETYISLPRDYNNESLMGDLVTDGMLWKADELDDGQFNDSVDIAFTNPGGLRADIEVVGTPPYTVTWGDTFNVLPFGNSLYMMDLTGAQVQALLDQAATLYKGILQSSGVTWSWYNDTGDATPTSWGASSVMVGDEPLDTEAVYRVVTNDFLAGGKDGWVTFAEGTNRRAYLYADMQEAVNEYIATITPIEEGDIEMGRITRMYRLHLPLIVKPLAGN